MIDVALWQFEYDHSLEDVVAYAVPDLAITHYYREHSLDRHIVVPRCEDLLAHEECRAVLSDVSSASLLWPATTDRALLLGGSPVDRPFVQLSFR